MAGLVGAGEKDTDMGESVGLANGLDEKRDNPG